MTTFLGMLMVDGVLMMLADTKIKFIDVIFNVILKIWLFMSVCCSLRFVGVPLGWRIAIFLYSLMMLAYVIMEDKKRRTKNKISENVERQRQRGKYDIEEIPLKIGVASVEGTRKDKLKITVKSTTGKIYDFYSIGNNIESVKTVDMMQGMKYGKV